jgi:hypothetical protein
MKNNHFSRKWIILLIMAMITVSACNLFSNILNPVDQVVSEVEDIATQVNIDNIEELQENIQTMVPEIPTDLGDLQATAEAVQEDFASGEAPPDIPIVEGETENFFASEVFVSYTTPMDFDEVVTYYQEEMPKNGWQSDDESSFSIEGTSLFYFTKSNRVAIVTISSEAADGATAVLITLQSE